MSDAPISRYPLQWPTGWKRTDSALRRRAQFRNPGQRSSYYQQVTTAEGLARVQDVLRKMGVGDGEVVISTNMPTRLDGLPRSNLPEPADPGVAVYWQAGKQRRCMAIDEYTAVGANLAAVAATLEALRAIERHGGAAILDRAFLGFAALPAPASTARHWRVVLGVPLGSVPHLEDVRRSYRELAARHHPDRPGGNAEAMAEVNRAWEEAQQECER